ncbi:hypothetical protein Tco_0920390 [Tanacetum coccineum]
MFVVCACSRFQVTPKTSHLHAVKRIFRYLKGKPKLGLWYPRVSSFDLEAYSDSDYAGANLDRKSTTGGCQFLGRRLISWQCQKQTIVATSTTEAEYVAAANCCRQLLWIQNQMLDYWFNFMNIKIYIDNESTICIVKNSVFHSKTKHIEIRHHFIRDAYEKLIQLLMLGGLRATYSAALVSTASLVNTARPKLSTARLGLCCSKVFNNGVDDWIGLKMQFILDLRNTTSSQTVNDKKKIHATVDSKAVVVTEASIRSSLLLNDANGTACLTNEAIFQNLALMGWNEFSTNIASAVICLATNQKFNFSKLIFDGMLRNLDNPKKKFLMYPRFLMVFLNNQIELGELFNDVYTAPAHNLKVFSNMSRKGLKFSEKITPLFPNMLIQSVGEGSGAPTEPQPTPSPTHPSTGDQSPVTESSSSHHTTQDSRDSLEGTNGSEGVQVHTPYDSPLSGGHTSARAKGALNLQELFVLCTNFSNRVLALETVKDDQAAELLKLRTRIKKLERKCKPSVSHHIAWLKSVQRLSMKKSTFDDLDADHGMDYIEIEDVVKDGRLSEETEEFKLTADTKEIVEDKGSGEKGESTEELVSTVVPEIVSTTKLDVDTARQEVIDVEPRTSPTTTSIFDDEDITMAQTLIKMKEEKAKEKGVSIKDIEDSLRLARSILTLKPLPTIDPKDKGKGVLEEP